MNLNRLYIAFSPTCRSILWLVPSEAGEWAFLLKGANKMKMLQATGNNTMQHIFIKGNVAEPEPGEFYIHFPGGQIGVSRCSDGSYWAHLNLEDEKEDGSGREKKSNIIDTRIDCKGLHAGEMSIGDMARPDCYHVAIKIQVT